MLIRTALSLALVAVVGCAKPPPTFQDVPPAADLYAEGQEMLASGTWLWIFPRVKHTKAIEVFQSIIDNYPYSEYAVLAELAIADSYFGEAKYEEALSYYRDFTDLHPQNEKVPYAIYRAAMCHAQRVESPNRDQTATRQALDFLDQLLATYPYSEYADEGEDLWRKLRLQLALQVENIGDFYMRRGEWESAAERYRSLLNEFPGLGLDAEGLYKLGVCYAEMNRLVEAESIFQAIVQNYQDTDAASDAADQIADLERET
ncbi:MAG: outer membrane protein assembly factor BamD [Myxococcota bacterium]|nr:outer membrane protein assembly factor BamD [bacterium]MDP6074966.1 outer membrane protein assembly factor BamD [Myxococcota bacterium]MDP6243100.1 outer membrane protein assembly factor BamD [Myxococcota bacterium]MDP7076275.1 outer membrane protein assembly factor BamD [Myxococcota bacterium]MDP7298078.1 outer membrane protein assembly factor BamD [Myxococcota bacterium]